MIAMLFAPGPFGGAEKVVLEGAKALDMEIWIIVESRNPEPAMLFAERCKKEKVLTLLIPSKKRVDLLAAKHIRVMAQNYGVTLLHSHGIKANFLACLSGIKFIGTQHGKTSRTLKTRFMEYIEDICLKKAKKTICVSNEQFNSGIYKNGILIPNFYSFTNLTEVLPASNTGLSFLYLGRLEREKGAHILIDAIKDFPNINLSIAGKGDQEIELKEQAKGLENVKFLGFKTNIESLLQTHQVLVMPSLREGLPMAALEAASAGLPIIGSNVGSIYEVTGEKSLLARPGDVEELKAKIKDYLRMPSYYMEQASKRSKVVKETFSLETWKEKTLEVYKSLS